MINKDIGKEELFQNQILKEFYQNKHILLIGMGLREQAGEENTVIDIKKAYSLRKEYVWKLLGELKNDGLIEQADRVQKEVSSYHNHILTPVAKDSLQELFSWLYYYNNGEKEELDMNIEHLPLSHGEV